MCGICGYYKLDRYAQTEKDLLYRMLSLLRHRGPDESGVYQDKYLGLGQTRLSVIDLERGKQPIPNEDKSIWIVCNGEIFNYIELRRELKSKGHRFKTSSDTEVIVHLYEELGVGCLERLNGQFAFAVWDGRTQELFMARDRLGIEPLFYTKRKDNFIFASEIKAILAYPGITPIIDIEAIDQIFTFWATISPKTVFKDISEVPPGHYLRIKQGAIEEGKYWELDFPARGEYEKKPEKYYLENLDSLLIDAIRIRLRSDVPVGAYLSGGIDSSTVASIMRKRIGRRLETFSIKFSDPQYDETFYQDIIIDYLAAANSGLSCSNEDIAGSYPRVIWHTEAPTLRTAPVPLYLLSHLVREKGLKVVLTGDGADEFLLGYDIFKEVKIRRFWAKEPTSKMRAALLKKLYPYLPLVRAGDGSYLKKFFEKGLKNSGGLFYSHLLRWQTTSRIKHYFSDELKDALKKYDGLEELKRLLPAAFSKWDYMARAQYLEITLFLSNFLLSSQGDRVAMANSVEVRYPYLDHRLVEFCNRIPPDVRMKGLNEKYLLKKDAVKYLPKEIIKRQKQPYRAPNVDLFSNKKNFGYISEILSPKKIKEAGYFNPDYVAALIKKLDKKDKFYSEVDAMALNGILSLQLLFQIFIKDLKEYI